MEQPVFIIVGGDLRQLSCARALSACGTVYAVGFDREVSVPPEVHALTFGELSGLTGDYLVLPMPCSDDDKTVNAPFCTQPIPLSLLPSVCKPDGIVFGGRMGRDVTEIFAKASRTVIDYFGSEELNVRNAVPTAEGAVMLAMQEMATTLAGTQVLVTGFGRIAKVLIRLLTGYGARVTVTARSYADLAWAEIMGCRAVHISALLPVLPEFALIFNTVPAVVLDEAHLRRVDPEALILDLASKPGGVDFETASRLGVRTIWALSLPRGRMRWRRISA